MPFAKFRGTTGSAPMLLLMLAACGEKSLKSSLDTVDPKLFSDEDLVYRYDEASGRCLDPDGKEGLNDNRFAQCGLVYRKKLKEIKVSGRDLRGLRVRYSRLRNADFRGADLRDSRFERVEIVGADFRNADLRRASVLAAPKNFSVDSDAFRGARFDFHTYFSPGLVSNDLLLQKGRPQEELPQADPVEIDREVPTSEAALFRYDVARLSELSLKVGPEDPRLIRAVFDEIDSPESWSRYFKERVSLLVHDPEIRKIEGVIAVNRSVDAFYASRELDQWKILRILDDVRGFFGEPAILTPAEAPSSRWSRINGAPRNFETSGSGLVGLGETYVKRPNFDRIETLLHEARHTDCPVPASDPDRKSIEASSVEIEKLSAQARALLKTVSAGAAGTEQRRELSRIASDVWKLRASVSEAFDRLRENQSCNYSHVRCPKDHPTSWLRGKFACDGRAWGPYAVGAAFLIKLSRDCESCTGPTKAEAELEAADQLDRLLNLEEMTRPDSTLPPKDFWREPRPTAREGS